jgi:hypothetical protein
MLEGILERQTSCVVKKGKERERNGSVRQSYILLLHVMLDETVASDKTNKNRTEQIQADKSSIVTNTSCTVM